MSAGLHLGVNQLSVHAYFVASAIRWDEGDLSELRFKLFEQISRQTDGAIGVVSDRAVFDINFVKHVNLLKFNKTPRR